MSSVAEPEREGCSATRIGLQVRSRTGRYDLDTYATSCAHLRLERQKSNWKSTAGVHTRWRGAHGSWGSA